MNDEGSRRDAPQAMDDSERSHLDVSLSIRDLENSYRSGRGSGSFVLGEAKTMDDDAKEQQQRRDVPIATPASHNDPNSNSTNRPDIRNRMSASVPLPLPAAAAGTNHISPHTPMPPQVDIANNRSTSVESPPPSTHSQNSQALAALYQSSRRSRGTGTPRSKEGVSIETQGRLPPPPPLYAATPSSAEENSLRGSFFPTHLGPAAREAERRAAVEEARRLARSHANNDNDDNDPHKISLQSSSGGGLHDSWGTSMSSLMNSMNSNASFVYHASRMSASSQGPQGLQVGFCQPTAHQDQGQGMQGRGGGGRPRQFPGAFGNLANFKFEDRRLSVESHDHSVHSLPGAGSRDSGQSEQLKNYKMEDDSHHAHLTVPSLSDVSSEAPRTTASTPSIGHMGEQLSHLQVRSRDEFERRERSESTAMEEDAASNKTRESKRAADPPSRDEGEGTDDRNSGTAQPPSKKQNRRKSVEVQQDDERPQVERPQVQVQPPSQDLDYLTPHTQKSTLSSASFDLIAHPPTSRISSILSPEVSPLGDADVMDLYDIDAHADLERGRQRMPTDNQRQEDQDRGPQSEDPPGISPLKSPHQAQVVKPDHPHEETASEKDQRIVRRKVERLLLIRHCSTCDVPNGPASVAEILPPPPLVAGDESKEKDAQPSAPPVCPATSHCAEGKALCAHIRHCRDARCKFKKCLTSREVLGHYISCRDKYCGVCGPVRAADAKRRHRQKRRGSGDSSIETIDDEFWLNANMESAHTMVDNKDPEKEERR